MNFQKIVLIIAIVILLICLVAIGVTLSYAKNSAYPSAPPVCPDYWKVNDSDPNNIVCQNVKNLGICSPPSGSNYLEINVSQSPYTGANGLCGKYTWANRCGISWDGVTYGVPNPCAAVTA
jgi:hypothetical protein